METTVHLVADEVIREHRSQFDTDGRLLPNVSHRDIARICRERGGVQRSFRATFWGFLFPDRSELYWGPDPATVSDGRIRSITAEGNRCRMLDSRADGIDRGFGVDFEIE